MTIIKSTRRNPSHAMYLFDENATTIETMFKFAVDQCIVFVDKKEANAYIKNMEEKCKNKKVDLGYIYPYIMNFIGTLYTKNDR